MFPKYSEWYSRFLIGFYFHTALLKQCLLELSLLWFFRLSFWKIPIPPLFGQSFKSPQNVALEFAALEVLNLNNVVNQFQELGFFKIATRMASLVVVVVVVLFFWRLAILLGAALQLNERLELGPTTMNKSVVMISIFFSFPPPPLLSVEIPNFFIAQTIVIHEGFIIEMADDSL